MNNEMRMMSLEQALKPPPPLWIRLPVRRELSFHEADAAHTLLNLFVCTDDTNSESTDDASVASRVSKRRRTGNRDRRAV